MEKDNSTFGLFDIVLARLDSKNKLDEARTAETNMHHARENVIAQMLFNPDNKEAVKASFIESGVAKIAAIDATLDMLGTLPRLIDSADVNNLTPEQRHKNNLLMKQRENAIEDLKALREKISNSKIYRR